MQVQGRAYERQMEQVLREEYGRDADLIVGPWVQYNTGKLCQPDFVIIPKDAALPIIVVETKLTWKRSAITKLRMLYLPCAELIWGREAKGMHLVKRARPGAGPKKWHRFEDVMKRNRAKYFNIMWA